MLKTAETASDSQYAEKSITSSVLFWQSGLSIPYKKSTLNAPSSGHIGNIRLPLQQKENEGLDPG